MLLFQIIHRKVFNVVVFSMIVYDETSSDALMLSMRATCTHYPPEASNFPFNLFLVSNFVSHMTRLDLDPVVQRGDWVEMTSQLASSS